MKKIDANNPMVKVLLTLVQNFTNQEALGRVLDLMHDILTQLME